jgi:hypothetical protein
MAIFGKNGLYALGLYVGTLWALYGMKEVAFKDNDEVKRIASVAARAGKADIGEYRRQALSQKFKTDPGAEFRKAYGEKKYIR